MVVDLSLRGLQVQGAIDSALGIMPAIDAVLATPATSATAPAPELANPVAMLIMN